MFETICFLTLAVSLIMPYPILHPAVLRSWMQMKVLIDGLIGEASNKHDQLYDD